MPRARSASMIRGSSDEGKGPKTAGRASMCRTAVMRGPVSSDVKSSSSSSRSGMAHPMFSGSWLSTLRPACQAVGVTAGRFVPPLAWTVIIFWFGSGAWGAETTGIFALPLLHRLLPWAGPELLDLAHLLARKLGHVVGYAALGAFWWRALRRWRAAVLIAALTAFLDEARQAATVGRGASAADVVLDSAAAGVG